MAEVKLTEAQLAAFDAAAARKRRGGTEESLPPLVVEQVRAWIRHLKPGQNVSAGDVAKVIDVAHPEGKKKYPRYNAAKAILLGLLNELVTKLNEKDWQFRRV